MNLQGEDFLKKIVLYLSSVRIPVSRLSTKLHGFFMGKLDSDYADFLHQQQTNPFSMNVKLRNNKVIWTINLLDSQAELQMYDAVMNLERIKLRGIEEEMRVERIEEQELLQDNLVQIFNDSVSMGVMTIFFQTPTCFKSNDQYVLFPTVRLIFQSLMQKYSRIIEESKDIDEEMLTYIEEHVQITSYDLKTHYFTVHGKKIPAFVGRVSMKIQGASALKSYLKMLLVFGEYSGIGIKTSLGMGSMEFIAREN